MKDDPTIVRIRAARHQISEQYHHDPEQVIKHYIELEKQHQERFFESAEEKGILDYTNIEKGRETSTNASH